ncbi:hypothetical protein BXZ70DRAFT_934529 [Cristinia sonorae]|uniref:Uncharacterized protein n=1 Tax=Cristinia sonorae TaxID=1940300 RepID=A0A8K0UPB0_9AGAR|nr:hypothetical protein BXZ70DRAFT_934529 [Cristinia sonorae]
MLLVGADWCSQPLLPQMSNTTSEKKHSLRLTTSVATTRYDRQERVTPRHQIIPIGLFGIGHSPNPPYLPPLWAECVHPEGSYYFVRNSQPRVVTEANLRKPEIQKKIADWLDDINTFLTANDIQLPPTVELTLDPSEDLEDCAYYFVDHASRIEFWVDPVSTDQLGMRTSMSEAHLRYALEEHYWTHVEHFPSHKAQEMELCFAQLFDILLHAHADMTSSNVSTYPFCREELASYIQILTAARDADRLDSPHMRWTIARLWAVLYNHRFMTHYNQDVCRMSRDQSIIDFGTKLESRTFSLLSTLSFRTASTYKAALQRLWVDEIVYISDWRPFIAASHQDWLISVCMSFALLLCNLVSLQTPFSIEIFVLLSAVVCNAAILCGVTLMMKHQGAQSMTADEAVSICAFNEAEMC